MSRQTRSYHRIRWSLLLVGAALLVPPSCTPKQAPTPVLTVSLPDGPLTEPERAQMAALAATGKQVIAADAVRIPGEGSAFRLRGRPLLKAAYDAYLGGDGKAALDMLNRAQIVAKGTHDNWRLSLLRARTLLKMGRGTDAERELLRTAGLERATFGWDLNARAMRGAVRLWLGDHLAAEVDFARVVLAVGAWRLPRAAAAPDAKLAETAALATAQARATAGLAELYLLQERARDALPWAGLAERHFADIQTRASDPRYEPYISVQIESHHDRATNLAVLAAARLATADDPAAGAKLFDAATAYFKATGDGAGEATALAQRAWARLQIRDTAGAREAAGRAVDLAVERDLADLVWRLEVLHGEALIADGRAPAAEAAFRRAETAAQAVSGALASDRAKRRFGVGKADIAYHLAGYDLTAGDMAALFGDLERGHARAFVDLLADRPVALGRADRLVARIRTLEADIRRLRLIDAASADAPGAGATREAALLEARAAKLSELRYRDPELADAFSVAVTTLADVQRQLAEEEVMAYALPARPGDEIRLLMISEAAAGVRALGITVGQLGQLIDRFRAAVAADDAAGQEQAVRALAEALKFGAWAGLAATFVVPSGPLFFIPWGAFDTPAPVVVLPTGGWIHRRQVATVNGTTASIVGDPAFGGDMIQLPGARLEAETLARLYDTTALTGNAATEAALRRDIGDGVTILHLATRGQLDARLPLQSAVFLSNGHGADRFTAAEIFARPLAARLVVLSGAETGIGQVAPDDGYLGLARSFYLGGARAVITSLWPVSDEGTRIYMQEFHRYARFGDFGYAWLEARTAARQHGLPPSVYGAFVLGGALRL